ncbi:hypothetical protein J6TS2_51960 [Heyndrickxia sporothermodurans]|nr:hypothetical protein J6TS2_51960 [Heyndrickxia sporothermodurans]
MKRYISSIIIVAVTVFSIGGYYIYHAVSASPLPQLKIIKGSGSEKEIKDLKISGNYYKGPINENFDLSSKGITYYSERSYFERINNDSKRLQELKKQYRSFMRGKYHIDFEDKDLLVYTDFQSTYNQQGPLSISILNKQTKQESTFKIDIPNADHFGSVSVQEVIRQDDKLKIIADYDRLSDTSKNYNELHLYSIDMKSKKIIKDDIIDRPTEEQLNVETRYQHISSNDPYKPSDQYYVFKKDLVKPSKTEEERVVKSELFVYNLKTNRTVEIKIPKRLKNADVYLNLGSFVYFTILNNQEVKVAKFNIETQKVTSEYSQKFSNSNNEKLYKIVDDKLILFKPNIDANEKGTLSVIDINSGKSVFEGKIIVDKKGIEGNIEFHDLEIN